MQIQMQRRGNIIFKFGFSSFLLFFLINGNPYILGQENSTVDTLRFKHGEEGAFTFETNTLEGVLRLAGKSTGLVPVKYKVNGSPITKEEGLFNHYRVFSKGKRYGYGARRWPSKALLKDDGTVEVQWPSKPNRPFELKAHYRLVSENTIDLITEVRAKEKLKDFEVFLASYFDDGFLDSQVLVYDRNDKELEFVSANRDFGEWLAFPRDKDAVKIIADGRWDLEPHPLDWTLMPKLGQPVAIRRNKKTGVTVLAMSKYDDCFGVFTPYNEEKHVSNYMSLFGIDLQKGDVVSAHSRLVILLDPEEKEILEHIKDFMGDIKL